MPKTNIFKRLWRNFRIKVHVPLYVTLDSTDSSITLSKGLYRHMCLTSENPNKVMMTKVEDQYAIVPNPPFTEEQTVVADIQYNPKHRCVGFETNCPTVDGIIYDYDFNLSPYFYKGFPYPVCVMVKYQKVKDMPVYIIRRPRDTRPKLYKGLKTKE